MSKPIQFASALVILIVGAAVTYQIVLKCPDTEFSLKDTFSFSIKNCDGQEAPPETPLVLREPDPSNPPFCDTAGSPSPAAVPIKDAGGLTNLALLKDAKATASSAFPDPTGSRHRISYLNDGWYNNCRSWIPGNMPAWAQIDLGKDYLLEKIVFGSEHTGYYNDRAATNFTISVKAQNSTNWSVVYSHDSGSPVKATREFPISPINARWARIDVSASQPNPVRIDEFEIYGKAI